MLDGEPRPENRELDPNTLSFRQLEQAYALAQTSFAQTDNGFRSVNGDTITIGERNGIFIIVEFPNHKRQDLHFAVESGAYQMLKRGSSSREEIMNGVRTLLEQTGNRIIE